MKANKNSRWRAYARGTLDLCKRHTDAAISARSALSVAPKDVKQLECLRQPKDPTMSERYDAAVEKENKEWTSLIAASSTTTTESKKRKSDDALEGDSDDVGAESEEEAKVIEKPKKKPKNKKQKEQVSKAPTKVDETVLEMKDTVAEGIDWSDDDED